MTNLQLHPIGSKLSNAGDCYTNGDRYYGDGLLCVDSNKICSAEYDRLMDQLIDLGYTDKTLNEFKLYIYDFNIDIIKKYYKSDIFCHKLCVSGHCPEIDSSCKYKHIFAIRQLLNDSQNSETTIKQAMLLTDYFVYIYKNDKQLLNNDTDQYKRVMTSINEHYGDFYRITAQNEKDFITSDTFYDRSFVFSKKYRRRNLVQAKMLSDCLNNWKKAQKLFALAIDITQSDVCESTGAYEYFCYGMALSKRGYYDKAIDKFKTAIEIKPNNARYYYECAHCLFQKGPKYHQETLQMYRRVLSIISRNNRNIPNAGRLVISTHRRINEIEAYLTCNHNLPSDVTDCKQNRGDGDKILMTSDSATKITTTMYANAPVEGTFAPEDTQKRAFEEFWTNIKWEVDVKNGINSQTAKYYLRICEKRYNCMSILSFVNKEVLVQEIRMNNTDCNCFLNEMKTWHRKCDKFGDWLKHEDFYDLYYVRLSKYGIYTMDLLKWLVNQYPQSWHLNVLKCEATKDCFQADAQTIRKFVIGG